MRAVCIILMLIWSNAFLSGQSLPDEEKYLFAESLSASNNHKRALKEYLRAYYYDRENHNKEIALKICQSFMQTGDYPNALLFVEKYLYQNDLSIEEQNNGHYEKLNLLFKSGLFKEAYLALLTMDDTQRSFDPDRYQYFLSMSLIFTSKFDQAKKALYKLSYIDESNEMFAIDYVVGQIEEIHNTNHNKAVIMSMIIPGLGQAVNGEVKDGLNSLALTGGLTWVFFEVAESLSVIDGMISVVPWLGRYYIGGLQNAKRASIHRMNDNRRAEMLRLNEYLQKKQ